MAAGRMESYLKCPVTALKLTNKTILLTGQGSKLIIYDLPRNSLLLSIKIFNSSKIHKFIECAHSPGIWLVLGGKSVRCVQLDTEEECGVTFLSNEKIFKAWMWDAHWLSDKSLLFISAHNTVLYWNYSSQTTSAVSSCVQQCILYSATFSLLHDQLVVAAGTVFNKVLLWKPEYHGNCTHQYKDVYKMFVGHEGVIFCVRFNPLDQSQLLSVSDDRSIRLWSIINESCLQVLYGHTARVWDAQYIADHIVSISEDSLCILWNSDGCIEKKFTGHKGKNIWSLDVSDVYIITGGGDGAIRIWDIKSHLKLKGCPLELSIPDQRLEEIDDDFPRTAKIVAHSSLMIFTNNGILWRYDIYTGCWTIIHEDQRFRSYCCLDIHADYIAMGNLDGLVKIISIENPHHYYEEKLLPGKIFSLLWLPVHPHLFILLCGPEGEIKVSSLILNGKDISLNTKYLFTCPHSRQRWIAAATMFCSNPNNLVDDASLPGQDFILVCGDRRGSLHMYSATSKDPFQSILGVHGKTGVTQVLSHDGYIYSTGRDGTFKKHKFNSMEKQLQVIDVQRACKGMDWIEGIWFRNSKIVVYGFYMQSHFAAWSCETNELLFKIKCGGGYRSWDVSFPTPRDEALSFTYLKGAVINLVTYSWGSEDHHRIIQEGAHGKELNAVKVLGKNISKGVAHWLLATCSEDTTINFYIYDDNSRTLKGFHTAVGHIGGIKDICFVPFNTSDNDLLFNGFFISCGSRTSLKLWVLQNNFFSSMCNISSNTQNELSDHHFSCSLLTEIYTPEMTAKKSKLKLHHVIDDMRFMACDAFLLLSIFPELADRGDVICCICACSDGVVRIYAFHSTGVELLGLLDCDNHCVLSVSSYSCYVSNQSRNLVFAAATNGIVTIWDISAILEKYKDKLIRTMKKNTKADDSVGSSNNDYTNYDSPNNLYISSEEHSLWRDEHKVEVSERKSHVYHINKDKYKFHELCSPLYKDNEMCAKICLHQSGINTFAIHCSTNGLHIVSGGDDGSLCVVRLQENGFQFDVASKSTTHCAHISSISAVKFVNDSLIASTGVDQRIRFWSLLGTELTLVHQILTDVADISNMELWISSGVIHIAVCGVGIELFSILLVELENYAVHSNS